eukprot:TRINITY_DN82156_c0_g1_i1.p1 TRINITY_DN82156_c0_g1~~TRINITY_DN82156_c0_g1_i1.p1  ORF type:complete len:1057 (-),score=300.59 TRINITY_DN82156_c0_g1_i1:17-3130(-)
MAVEDLRQKQTPFCSLCLVIGAIACHTAVLMGNYKTGSAVSVMGTSTGGWSAIGVGLSRAFRKDLDEKMVGISEKLLDSLKEVTKVTEMIDQALSMIGVAADNETETPEGQALLLQLQGAPGTRRLSPTLLQMECDANLEAEEAPESPLAPLLRETVDDMIEKVLDLIMNGVVKVMEKLKPALEKVGEWILKFGNKIMDALDAFISSLDNVQKLFDKVMGQGNGGGDNEDLMLEQTFNLFDVSGTGFVTMPDLVDVSGLYSITALEGDKPKKLVHKYDEDGDDQLSTKEFALLVNDESVPNVMAVVLRTYAKRLSEVAGQVAAASQRDEVALAVTKYLSLVCAKNMTKVGWIAEAMTNGSMPEEFSASVMAQMCITSGSPGQLTGKDVGNTVVGAMYRQDAKTTVESVNLMSDVDFWVSNGFNPEQQPSCVEMVTGWVTDAKQKTVSLAALLDRSNETAVKNDETEFRILAAMPELARQLAEENLKKRSLEAIELSAQRRAALYSSATGKLLLNHLLGGVAATDGQQGSASMASPAERSISSGQPAKPETLQFASWLAANASYNAKLFQQYCFEYSSESSTPTDTFATQLKAFVKKIQSFIGMMQKYSTPAGIERLEGTITGFMQTVKFTVKGIVKMKVDPFIDTATPLAEQAVKKAARNAGEKVGEQVGNVLEGVLSGPMTDAASKPTEAITSKLLGPAVAGPLADQMGDKLADVVGEMTKDLIKEKAGDMAEDLVEQSLDKAREKLENHVSETSMLTVDASQELSEELMLGAINFDQVVTTLRALTNLVPTATQTLKLARTEVSKAASNMDSVFGVFGDKGPAIFDAISKYYKIAWTIYYFALIPLSLLMLYYAFWAGGYFGGPQPLEDGEDYQAPETWSEKFSLFRRSCGSCLTQFHDTSACFWSVIILLQLVVLVVFLMSVVLAMLAGVQTFITSGCAQVYILGDEAVCAAALANLKNFVGSFLGEIAINSLEDQCQADVLLTCQVVSTQMKSSSVLTTVFSFLGTILSLQMLIEIAVLHEMAKYRRVANAAK